MTTRKSKMGPRRSTVIVKEAKQWLYDNYLINPDDYKWSWSHDDMKIVWQVYGEHRKTGAGICISNIWPDDDGHIMQMGSQHGMLTI